MGDEPLAFRGESLASVVKWTETRAIARRKVGEPLSSGIRLDVAGAANVRRAQLVQVDRLVVDAADVAAR